ncbi:MAG: hypothetical protein IAG13_08840 [Deltaproteobacteria bacterium]|nr:hypothetical protein [Nannocystaceae bacterium]
MQRTHCSEDGLTHVVRDVVGLADAFLARIRVLIVLASVVLAVAIAGAPTTAEAAPAGGSASGGFSTGKGANGSSQRNGSGYDWPEVVVAGNAVSFLAPLQFGIVGYLPKARLGFQYDRQIHKGHWIQAGIAVLFDRAGYENFRMDSCGLENYSGLCKKGGVVGVDAYLGYTYRFFLRERPWLVPYVRANIGYSYFALPKVGGTREQERIHSQSLSLRPGGGLRFFLLDQLGIGFEIGVPVGFLVHAVRPDGGGKDRDGAFLLGVEVLPLVVEYRF